MGNRCRIGESGAILIGNYILHNGCNIYGNVARTGKITEIPGDCLPIDAGIPGIPCPVYG